MIDRFGDRIKELESVIREIAIDITTGTVVDRLPPEKVWETTGPKVSMVRELIKELREYLYILKPEKVPTIQQSVTGIFERLDLFQESLTMDRGAEGERSQASVDELRNALGEISEFVSLCRAIKADPSEIIESILTLRQGRKSDAPSITQSKMKYLGDLVQEAKSSYGEITELSTKMEHQLFAIKEECEDLYFSLSKKEEEE
jgi:hypothetical protein